MGSMTPPKGNGAKGSKTKGNTEKGSSGKGSKGNANKTKTHTEFENLSDSELSIEMTSESVVDLRKEFENKLNLFKAEIYGRVEALHRVVNDKDVIIGQLQSEIGELKKTCNFLTEETQDLRGQIKNNDIQIKSSAEKYNNIVDKTSDLEDQSR